MGGVGDGRVAIGGVNQAESHMAESIGAELGMAKLQLMESMELVEWQLVESMRESHTWQSHSGQILETAELQWVELMRESYCMADTGPRFIPARDPPNRDQTGHGPEVMSAVQNG